MPSRSARSLLLLALAIVAVVTLTGTWSMGFHGKDELRYAQIAKEMQNPGDFFFLHYQNEVYPDKPPLYFWSVRASYLLTGGVSPFGVRLPLILSTLLTALLTFDLGRRLFNLRTAFLAALFYGLSLRVQWSAHLAKLDPPLVLFTTLSLWFYVLGAPARAEGRRPSFGLVLGFWAAAGFGFLVKGPLSLVVPLGTILCERVWLRERRGLVGWSTIPGVLLFAAIIAGLWILPGLHYGGWEGYFEKIVGQEVIDRAADPWRHTKDGFFLNAFYYVGRLAGEFLPGALLLPAAFAAFLRLRREIEPAERRGVVFVLSWFLFVIVFFTLMRSKRGTYILPLYPAAGLLAGWVLDRAMRGAARLGRGWIHGPLGVFGGMCVLAGLAVQLPVTLDRLNREFQTPPSWATRLTLLAVLAGCGAAIIYYARRENLKRLVAWSLAPLPAVLMFALLVYFPRGYDDGPFREIAATVEALVPSGAVVYLPDDPDPNLNIYGDYYLKRFPTEDWLDEVSGRYVPGASEYTRLKVFSLVEEPMLMFVEGEDLEGFLEESPDADVFVVKRFDVLRYEEDGGVCLLANTPDWKTAFPGRP